MNYDPRVDSSPTAAGYHADPNAPEGSEEAAGFLADQALILVVEQVKVGEQLFPVCQCGCEQPMENAKSKSRFRQGHDQRLVGKLIRAGRNHAEVVLVDGAIVSGEAVSIATHLLSPDGVAKVEAGVQREAKPRKSRAKAQAERTIVGESEIKVGRWTYPARQWSTGEVERNSKRDGSGEWVAVDA